MKRAAPRDDQDPGRCTGAGWELGFAAGGLWFNSLLLCIFDSSYRKAGLAGPWAVMGMTKEAAAPSSSTWNWFLVVQRIKSLSRQKIWGGQIRVVLNIQHSLLQWHNAISFFCFHSIRTSSWNWVLFGQPLRVSENCSLRFYDLCWSTTSSSRARSSVCIVSCSFPSTLFLCFWAFVLHLWFYAQTQYHEILLQFFKVSLNFDLDFLPSLPLLLLKPFLQALRIAACVGSDLQTI